MLSQKRKKELLKLTLDTSIYVYKKQKFVVEMILKLSFYSVNLYMVYTTAYLLVQQINESGYSRNEKSLA